MPNNVTDVAAAASPVAVARFEAEFTFETDCSDVAAALSSGTPGFILVDVRSPTLFAEGHVPGAINVPHRALTPERLAAYPADTLFVVYCAGPHCNGATKGALKLARLGRPVKEMIGGIDGWEDEGFDLVDSEFVTDCPMTPTSSAPTATPISAKRPHAHRPRRRALAYVAPTIAAIPRVRS